MSHRYGIKIGPLGFNTKRSWDPAHPGTVGSRGSLLRCLRLNRSPPSRGKPARTHVLHRVYHLGGAQRSHSCLHSSSRRRRDSSPPCAPRACRAARLTTGRLVGSCSLLFPPHSPNAASECNPRTWPRAEDRGQRGGEGQLAAWGEPAGIRLNGDTNRTVSSHDFFSEYQSILHPHRRGPEGQAGRGWGAGGSSLMGSALILNQTLSHQSEL